MLTKPPNHHFRSSINQGELGDCWFLSALTGGIVPCPPPSHPLGLLENKHFFEKVFPPGQEFGRSYRGLFRFRFYRQGEWHQVCYQCKI